MDEINAVVGAQVDSSNNTIEGSTGTINDGGLHTHQNVSNDTSLTSYGDPGAQSSPEAGNWYDNFSDEIKSDPNLTKFKSPEEFLKSYKGLQNTVLNRLKDENVTLEELAAVLPPERLAELNAMKGAPARAEDYEMPEHNIDFAQHPVASKGLETAKALAHKYGIPNSVFKEFMALEMQVAQNSTHQFIQNNVNELRKQHGDQLNVKANAVANTIMKLGGKEAYDYFDSNKMFTNPHLFNMFSKVAERMQADPMPSGLKGFGANTQGSVKERLQQFFGSEKYSAYQRGDAAARQELEALYREANPYKG